MPLGITPVDNTPVEDNGFPTYIQFLAGGVPLGGPDATSVDFEAGLTATRGVGENANLITVTADGLQIQVEGTDLGNFSAINIGNGLTATADSAVVTITAAPPHLTWRDVPGDWTLEPSDAENGISTSGTTGSQNIIIPGDTGNPEFDFIDGSAVVVFQEGAAGVEFLPVSGVTLLYRSNQFLPMSAGQYATLTLIKRAANVWILCGDMATTS